MTENPYFKIYNQRFYILESWRSFDSIEDAKKEIKKQLEESRLTDVFLIVRYDFLGADGKFLEQEYTREYFSEKQNKQQEQTK